ncbi:MAG: helix-turn-helix domain-containing protein [Mesorhizobium sp.]|nr:helix-turn-helix domain-containing protein [Mesorhizobium sp.]
MAERLTQPRRVERRRWPRDEPAEDGATPALPVLKPLAFSTRSLAAADQFRAWQAHVSALLDVSLPEGVAESDGFAADHTAWNLGSMLVVQQSAPAHGYERPAAMLRSSAIDHWHVAIMRSGRSWTEVDGRVAANRPGEVQFGSLGNPFSGRATPSESLILYLPRDLFAQSTASLDAMNNTVLSGNAATLLIAYLNGVEARLSCLTEQDLPRIANATRDMILACIDPATEGEVTSDGTANLALIERARRYVQRNLAVENLSPGDMARALGVSRTRLYQLFEHSGGVLHYIQRRRLQAAHVALGDPADTRRIIDIAEAVGFTSAANFSRSFSKEFGYSPREARNAILSNRRTQPAVIATAEEGPSFDGWLKTLGS